MLLEQHSRAVGWALGKSTDHEEDFSHLVESSFVGVQFKKCSLPLKNSYMYPPAENLIKPLCSIGCSSEIY